MLFGALFGTVRNPCFAFFQVSFFYIPPPTPPLSGTVQRLFRALLRCKIIYSVRSLDSLQLELAAPFASSFFFVISFLEQSN